MREFEYLHRDVTEIVHKIFALQGIDICLTSGTDENGDEYPTDQVARGVFYREMDYVTNKMQHELRALIDDAFSNGEEQKILEIKKVLGLEEDE